MDKSNKTKEEMIDEMVNMLDEMVTNGTGHITLDGKDESGEREIKTWQSNDAAEGCFACRIPTLNDGSEDE